MVHDYGPYTLYDLDAMPEEGKRYELVDGWLTELSPSPWHDHAAEQLKGVLKAAARRAGSEVYVAGGPNDVSTPAGVRKPDAFVIPREAARDAIDGKTRTFYGADLLLVAEVISPRSASEQVDRVRKVREYAAAGIAHYWIIDLEPRPKVTALELDGGDYRMAREVHGGHALTTDTPYPITFDPACLTELD